ncbi:hypothetical protein LTR66_017123, partial [Elasticomyces elasticus]
MSLARAFTKRVRDTNDADLALPRSCTVRYTPGTIQRSKISLPTELISTTNTDAMNAPDIPNSRHRNISNLSSASSFSDGSSTSNDEHTDFISDFDKSFLSSETPTPADLSPITPMTDHNSGDFFSSKSVFAGATPTPAIPQRAPSH